MKLSGKEYLDELSRLVNEKKGILMHDLSKMKVNPLVKVYCYKDSLGIRFFDSEEDLIYFYGKYASKNGEFYVSEYLGDVFGETDVIRRVFIDSIQICTLRDLETYSVLEVEHYLSTGEVLWSFTFGNLRSEYLAFKKRGVDFQSDLYFEDDTYDRFKEFGRRKVLDIKWNNIVI